MRFIGASLLIAASILSGACAVRMKKRRLCTLRELCEALEIMQGELSLHNSSLPEMFRLLSIHGTGKAGEIFSLLLEQLPLLGECSFSYIWDKALYCCRDELNPSERETLKSLGFYLGRYDTETQIRQLRACLTVLQTNLAEEEKSFPTERKLLLGLSASAGAMIAILLV